MKRQNQNETQLPTSHRSAFTLVEILTVIAIISILVALVSPAILNALGSAEEAAVAVELTQLDQALTAFNAKFDRYPPSSITLYGDKAGWDGDPVAKSAIRSIWRDFDFSTGGRVASGVPQSDPSLPDFHPWGTDMITLTGDECLVFFLSGVPDSNGTLTGFSVDSRRPFQVGGSRIDPFFTGWKDRETRLIDTDGDGIFAYTDGLSDTDATIFYSAATRGRYASSQPAYFQADGTTPWNPDTFQLIAPGEDGNLGTITEAAAGAKVIWSEGITLGNTRQTERDNITNFAGGTLE